MGRLGLPGDYVKVVFALYNSASSRVLVEGALGNNIPITRSVRQGFPLAPYYFYMWEDPLVHSCIEQVIY